MRNKFQVALGDKLKCELEQTRYGTHLFAIQNILFIRFKSHGECFQYDYCFKGLKRVTKWLNSNMQMSFNE